MENIVIYDGPPFPNGKPHHGHALTSCAKDTIIRYFENTGSRATRTFGWDVHGCPEENITGHIGEWKKMFKLIGRNLNLDTEFRTDDKTYTESVNWAYQKCIDNGHMVTDPILAKYCSNCEDYLSDFDNQSKRIEFTSYYYQVPLTDELDILVWETNLWMSKNTVAYCYNPNIEYVIDNGIISAATTTHLNNELAPILRKMRNGETIQMMSGLKLLPCYSVRDDLGSGFVQLSPCCNKQSLRYCRDMNLKWSWPNDKNPDLCHKPSFTINKTEQIWRKVDYCVHCQSTMNSWRYDGPHIKITDNLKIKLAEMFMSIYWEPRELKTLILKYLQSTDYWIIGRTTDTGHKIKGTDFFYDSWFESCSMPWASVGYPDNKELQLQFEYPATVAIEGRDQIQGWFYGCVVLAACLGFGIPFKNVIGNGLVLDSTGIKLSKTIQTKAPSPEYIINKHGADNYRMYLLESRLLNGISIVFHEDRINDFITKALIHACDTIALQGVSINVRPKHVVNITDNWIMQSLDNFLVGYREQMNKFKLAKSILKIREFLANFKTYLNLNKSRSNSNSDNIHHSVAVQVLINVVKATEPFAPFTCNIIKERLKYHVSNRIWSQPLPKNIWCTNKKFLVASDILFNIIKMIKELPDEELDVHMHMTIYLDDINVIRGVERYIRQYIPKTMSFEYNTNIDSVMHYDIEYPDDTIPTNIRYVLGQLNGKDIRSIEHKGYYRHDNDKKYRWGQFVFNPVQNSKSNSNSNQIFKYNNGVLLIGKINKDNLFYSKIPDKMIAECQKIGKQLKREMWGLQRIIIYISHRTINEIHDPYVRRVLENLNSYVLPIMGQTLYQYSGQDYIKAINMQVDNEALHFYFSQVDLELHT